MREPSVETLPWESQRALDDQTYRRQIAYLIERSPFCHAKLSSAGFDTAERVGGLDAIAALPFTEKAELRATVTDDNPIGTHLAVPRERIARVYSTSGTTGTPSYIPLTAQDLDNWIATSARSYGASGVASGEAIVSTYNAGPFVAGAALQTFDRLGLAHIPVGTGNTDRLMKAVRLLRPSAAVMTPSYASYLVEWAEAHDFDLAGSTVTRLLLGGEPGGGEAKLRARLEKGWGAQVTEVMGIGDIGISLWGECEEQCGMHFGARGTVYPELIDPDTGAALEWCDGARGELVLTHLKHEAAPLLRFRTRDHVEVWTSTCRCGRTAPRVRCIGRTDDMLIVRGVNVFPSAVRDVVGAFLPEVSGVILIRPAAAGVKQEPPLPIQVELAKGAEATEALAQGIRDRLRAALVFTAGIELVPFGTLQRSEYKSKLVQH